MQDAFNTLLTQPEWLWVRFPDHSPARCSGRRQRPRSHPAVEIVRLIGRRDQQTVKDGLSLRRRNAGVALADVLFSSDEASARRT